MLAVKLSRGTSHAPRFTMGPTHDHRSPSRSQLLGLVIVAVALSLYVWGSG